MFKFTVVFLALAVGLVAAVPAPAPSQNVDATRDASSEEPAFVIVKANATKRASPGVYFCENANFLGACYGATPRYKNTISSFGPDKGLKCQLYLDGRCAQGPSRGPIHHPGIDSQQEFIQHGINYHDQVNSFFCSQLL
ncbi:hypothetical protein AURDEDRAFT_127884 [Auricularia subglabra TFB-10046 SS5]|nr:hypothetical protein AURDEDRAFT_127884 [Auricularia subglabra TFB-10046 SS5]